MKDQMLHSVGPKEQKFDQYDNDEWKQNKLSNNYIVMNDLRYQSGHNPIEFN